MITPHLWEVIVSNIGLVYRGPDGFEARRTYGQYVAKSKNNEGRAAGEGVIMMMDGEIVHELEPREEPHIIR